MTNRLFKILYCLAILTAFILTGCSQPRKGDLLAYQPAVEPNIMTDYAFRAIEATGGLKAWSKAKVLRFDCVLTFYSSDGSFYLTEAHLDVYPWSNSIRISATEPQGRFVWLLSQNRLTSAEAPPQKEPLYDIQDTIYTARDIITAPVRLLGGTIDPKHCTWQPDQSPIPATRPNPVKIEGSWYEPIRRTYPLIQAQPVKPHWFKAIFFGAKPVEPPQPYWNGIVFYQNKDSSLIDRLWLVGNQQDKFLAVHAYDYREAKTLTEPVLETAAVRVPAKIELFQTDANGFLQQRVVKMDIRQSSP